MVSPWLRKSTITWFVSQNPQANRYDLCGQIGEGVAYLHHNKIIHGDIKGANILISDDNVPKITDFGTSRLSQYTLDFEQTTGPPGMTLRWAAPELVKGEGRQSTQADVYGLGMTYLEVITGSVPYHEVSDYAVIWKIIGKVHPTRPHCIPTGNKRDDQIWLLLKACWMHNPEKRPTARVVTAAMNDILAMQGNDWSAHWQSQVISIVIGGLCGFEWYTSIMGIASLEMQLATICALAMATLLLVSLSKIDLEAIGQNPITRAKFKCRFFSPAFLVFSSIMIAAVLVITFNQVLFYEAQLNFLLFHIYEALLRLLLPYIHAVQYLSNIALGCTWFTLICMAELIYQLVMGLPVIIFALLFVVSYIWLSLMALVILTEAFRPHKQ
ncbi:kinase-like domain-containing protein [Rhizoctonia solani]|nr:kinase-like domain-containing protein [Rhizoctonia solani]